MKLIDAIYVKRVGCAPELIRFINTDSAENAVRLLLKQPDVAFATLTLDLPLAKPVPADEFVVNMLRYL